MMTAAKKLTIASPDAAALIIAQVAAAPSSPSHSAIILAMQSIVSTCKLMVTSGLKNDHGQELLSVGLHEHRLAVVGSAASGSVV